MKTIKKGNGAPNDKSARFTCDKCGSRIEAKKSEGKYQSDLRDGDFIEVKCPECKQKNNISVDLFQL